MTDNSHLEEEARRLMKFDSYKEAELRTGKSYKDDEYTSDLGTYLGFKASDAKKAVLQQLGDTHFGSSWAEFLQIVLEEGFEIRFKQVGGNNRKDPFQEDAPQDDEHIIAYHPLQHVLLDACSYRGGNTAVINNLRVYFNRESDYDIRWTANWSGGIDVPLAEEQGRYITTGDFQGTEAFRMRFRELCSESIAVDPWLKAPYMTLDSYWESRIHHADESMDHTQRETARKALVLKRLSQCNLNPADFGITE